MSQFKIMFKSSRWEDVVIEAAACQISGTGEFVSFEDEYDSIVGIFCADLVAGVFKMPEEEEA